MITRARACIPYFDYEWRFLSNFYVEPDGTCVEWEYQRAKCARAHDRFTFDKYKADPKSCKALGNKVRLRPDWEDVKVEIMLFHVTKKFADHPELARKLLATGEAYLEEGNPWGDQFWGVSRGKGLNMLGHILMEVRDGLSGTA